MMDWLKASDPMGLLELCAQLHHQDPVAVQSKINKYLMRITSAKVVFMIVVSEDVDEFSIQVVGDKRLDPVVKISATNGSFGGAFIRSKPVTLADLSSTDRQLVDDLVAFPYQSLLCVPIFKGEAPTLLTCLVQKVGRPSFSPRDAALVSECFRVTLGIVVNTISFADEHRIRMQCQSLLTVAQNLFVRLDDVTELLKEIMYEAKYLTKAERCSLFLVDRDRNELVAKVFDGSDDSAEIRLPMSLGVVGHVAGSGKLINIKDAYSHPLFFKGVDEETGFKTRNILCFPIKDGGGIIGVAQLCNKVSGLFFSKLDEEIATAFSVYCGIAIMHSLMYKKVHDAQHRTKVSNELMMFHMKVNDEDVKKLARKPVPTPEDINPGFRDFIFMPRTLPDCDTARAVLAMFSDLNMIERARVRPEILARFILMAKKGYRDPPYHNWKHAFSVAHYCYLLIKNLRLVEGGILSELECLSLMVATLCHDLDHRGTTNSFQIASQSVLASLYSSEGSVLERHHFAQTMCILNTSECNILENLPPNEYEECINLLRELILATDLVNHLGLLPQQKQMAAEGYEPTNPTHHKLLRCLIMTACDFSDQTKDWVSSKRIAELIYKEFFSQGDLEKAMGNRPSEMMDREKACIPRLQIQFIEDFALPVFATLAGLFPSVKGSLAALKRNKHCWEIAQRIFLSRKTECRSSLEILEDDSIVDEVMTNVRRDVESVSKNVGKLESTLSEQGSCSTGPRGVYNGECFAPVGITSPHSRAKCRSESDMDLESGV